MSRYFYSAQPRLSPGVLEGLDPFIARTLQAADNAGMRYAWFEDMGRSMLQPLADAGFEVQFNGEEHDTRKIMVSW